MLFKVTTYQRAILDLAVLQSGRTLADFARRALDVACQTTQQVEWAAAVQSLPPGADAHEHFMKHLVRRKLEIEAAAAAAKLAGL